MTRRLIVCSALLALALGVGGCGGSGLRTERPLHLRTAAVILECGQTVEVRPAQLTIACADDGISLVGLRWASWGAETAQATGHVLDNPCVPSCVASRQVSYPVHVTVSDLLIGSHYAAYYLIAIRATGRHPAHTPGVIDEDFETSGPRGRA